ncbi:Crp/Fnr family transcriptional regulator [Lottiidibacillus patelloidae]|uniref:Crp/Fnr family transcriptional regulator n=1 Tax=Lottiidibacillus patelloidae TaxID=2670334 RepID=A0A263BS30_9BACI|nr:DoxX family protein [Lottiidibacillus patelloidae]OZM56520.1 Crp/Fnr family transcriptional regulator [Lottiidibacillus patelloidae]
MFVTFLRKNRFMPLIFLILRFYLGWAWLTAGWGKVTGEFNAEGYLKGAVKKASGEHPSVQGWWADFLSSFAIPNVELFNFLVPWGELLVGIALLLGSFTTFAALMGAVMNFAFLFSGTISTNPQMVLITVFLLVAGANAGKIGLDRWLLPLVDNTWNRILNRKDRRKSDFPM